MIDKNITKNNENLLYIEYIPLAKFVKILISLVFLFSIFMVITISALIPQVMIPILIISGGLCFFILLVYLNYRGLQIVLTRNQIKVKYGIFNHKKILLKEIMSCETTKATFKKYGGVGIRIGSDGSRAYNTDFGDAVKLTYQNGRPFVFSTRKPQKVCNLINNLSKFK